MKYAAAGGWYRSHPSRVRGLKRLRYSIHAYAFVAPLAGAWIET